MDDLVFKHTECLDFWIEAMGLYAHNSTTV